MPATCATAGMRDTEKRALLAAAANAAAAGTPELEAARLGRSSSPLELGRHKRKTKNYTGSLNEVGIGLARDGPAVCAACEEAAPAKSHAGGHRTLALTPTGSC